MIKEVTDFLQKHLDYLNKWPDSRVNEFMHWYADNGCIFAVGGPSLISAACLVRIVDSKDREDNIQPYKHNVEGDTFWIEMMASEDPKARRHLYNMVLAQYPEKKYIAYERLSQGNRIKYFSFNRFKKLHKEINCYG